MYPVAISSWRLRWPLLVSLVAVLALGVIALVAGDLRAPAGTRGKVAFVRPTPAKQLPPIPRPRSEPALPSAAAAAPVSIKAALPGAGEAEVCGLGIVKVDARDPDGLEHIPEAARRATWDRMRGVFAASADQRVQAIGLVLEARGSSAHAAPARDTLARIAAVTDDALVYALAVDGCNALDAKPAGGACQLVSAEQWARLDPHNAVPWLGVAWRARSRGDAGGEAEAVYRASLARISDPHAAVVPMMIGQALPADLPPLGRTIALVDAWRVQAAFHRPGHDAASRYCAAAAVADSNLRQVCDQLARLLLDGGRAMLDPLTGRTIGARVGWPADEVQALSDEHEALLHTTRERATGSTALSCENVTRMAQWATDAARLGEVGAARELLHRSGKSIEQALAEQRLAAQAARAAASAVAPGTLASLDASEAAPGGALDAGATVSLPQ